MDTVASAYLELSGEMRKRSRQSEFHVTEDAQYIMKWPFDKMAHFGFATAAIS